MRKLKLCEGYYDEGHWHEVSLVGSVSYPEGYDFSRIDHIMEGEKLFITGRFAGYDPELHAIVYVESGRGCECDGCRQDDCTSEIPCSFCPFSSGDQTQYFRLPHNATFDENTLEINLSYSSDDLIEEVEADIAEFGADEEVCVTVKHYPNEGIFFYTGYDFENIPEEELEDNEDTVFMTLGELLPKLKKQNAIMGDEEE